MVCRFLLPPVVSHICPHGSRMHDFYSHKCAITLFGIFRAQKFLRGRQSCLYNEQCFSKCPGGIGDGLEKRNNQTGGWLIFAPLQRFTMNVCRHERERTAKPFVNLMAKFLYLVYFKNCWDETHLKKGYFWRTATAVFFRGVIEINSSSEFSYEILHRYGRTTGREVDNRDECWGQLIA